jgi:hypothetical protein
MRMKNPIVIAQNNISQHLSIMRTTEKDFVLKEVKKTNFGYTISHYEI